MKYCFAAIIPLLILFSVFSCKPDDEILTRDAGAKLEFSTDTVFFDTVFVSTGSVSKRLKIYNRNKRAVKIDRIQLEKLGASDFDLIIDGEAKDMASGITIRGEDSLLILVKVFIDPNNSTKPFIIEDNLQFETNGNRQQVVLRAFGQNANFFRDEVLDCNTIWEGPKAYVLYGIVVVPENCTLTIRAGTKVYGHAEAILYVQGTLKVEGTASKRVFFQNDRRDSTFAHVPGQWEGLFFDTMSRNNKLQFAEIKNATYGLRMINFDGNQSVIENTIIKNIFYAGILALDTDVKITNTLITNCGQFAFAGIGGGKYDFNYCTIANYTPEFKRDDEAVVFSDSAIYKNALRPIKDPIVTFRNSLLWNGTRNGKLENEILFLTREGLKNVTVENSLIQTIRYQNESKFTGNGNILNQDPKFTQPGDGSVLARKISYSLKKDSPAIGGARLNGTTIDLPGEPRPQGANPSPDMGAYENKD
ncbi:choice-of-anchor Q domain-containing protein [Adhaeribacter terreus]|uniref:Choice-of-anchor Q domain-containing protein n=1 Tax=Adhaeribacter terreus TaxID=529703 RepID=A0ABW0EDU5_9BACT